MRTSIVALIGLAGLAACDSITDGGADVPPPQNLYYELEPSGDYEAPLGVLLVWDDMADDPELLVYRIYSSPDDEVYALRGETTSNTFHDNGIPDLYYYVVAVDLDGDESATSNIVTIDERLRLESPAWIESTSLDEAVYLWWSDNPFANEPTGFEQYRVYSASYTLGDEYCGDDWELEGTTIAPEFLVGVLTNGFSRCFAVSAESIEGWESMWSPVRADTPRPESRNVVMAAFEADQTIAGFRFWRDANGDGLTTRAELGLVLDGSRADLDFYVTRDGQGDFYLAPVRLGTTVALYGDAPVGDLTSIDIAPETGFSTFAIQALPMWGYVFEMDGGDGFARYGALRVTHVGTDYLIFDWSYQTDPGNPELSVGAGVFTDDAEGVVIRP
jgi:hypothetical protein